MPHQMRHSGVSIDLNTKFRSLQEIRNAEGGGNICPWHATRNTRDFKPLPVDTSPRLIAFLRIACDDFVDAIWNRAKNDLCPLSDEGPVRGPGVSWWEWYGTCMSTHGFRSPFLGVGQVRGKPGRQPSLPATYISRGDSWKCSVCLRRCSVCESAQFAQVHRNDVENSRCL